MAPANRVEAESILDSKTLLSASVVLIIVFLLVVLFCACGGKKKKEDADAGGGGGGGGDGDKPKSSKEKQPEKGATYWDVEPGPPTGDKEKKREAPVKKGIEESNPAYQTLINNSKFEASQAKVSASGLPPPPMCPTPDSDIQGPSKMPKMSMVAESNPAYQTILATSKFEATQAASPNAASKVGGMSMMKTAMANTQLKSVVKTTKK